MRVHSDAKSVSIPVPDMTALIARLEAAEATGIIMESDAVALCRALDLEDVELDDDGCGYHWVTVCWNALRGSLDAALALSERVLPGWRKFVEVVGDGRGSACVFLAHESIDRPWFHAPTPALALCIAILRAIQHGYEAAGEVSPILKAKAQGEGG